MVTVYDPFATFFGLAFFMAFFGILFGAVLFPWLPFVMLDSMGDWWRSRGERELQRAHAERERAAAAEARERAALIRDLRLGAQHGLVDPYQAQWYINQLQPPQVQRPPQLAQPPARQQPWQPWHVEVPGQAEIVEGAYQLLEQAHTALARRR